MFEGCPAHPQSSIHIFFGNSDLRELCFHYVDPPTLLTVSAVCRSFRASCFSIEFLRQRLTAYKRVLHNQMPTPSKRDFEGFRPDVMLIGADGQYLMIHHKDETDICGTEDWGTSSVIVFPSERMYRDVPRIESPGLFAIGSLCFGFEKGDLSCWKVVIRQVSDWSTASERHLETNPISTSPTEFWGTLGLYSDLLVQFSRTDGIIAVWDTSLRRSWLLQTSSHIDHLVILPSGDTIVAFGTDSKIYVWEDISWKDAKGPVRMNHRSFAVPNDALGISKVGLRGLSLFHENTSDSSRTYAGMLLPNELVDEQLTGEFSDGTAVIRKEGKQYEGWDGNLYQDMIFCIFKDKALLGRFKHSEAYQSPIFMDTWIITAAYGVLRFWSRTGKLCRQFDLEPKCSCRMQLVLEGDSSIVLFCDDMTEATVLEFGRSLIQPNVRAK